MCTRVRRREEAKEDHDDGCAAVVVVFVPTERFLRHRLLHGCPDVVDVGHAALERKPANRSKALVSMHTSKQIQMEEVIGMGY